MKILDEKLATDTLEEIISYFKEYKPKVQNCLKIGRSKSISEASDTEQSDDCEQTRGIEDRNNKNKNIKNKNLLGASTQVMGINGSRTIMFIFSSGEARGQAGPVETMGVKSFLHRIKTFLMEGEGTIKYSLKTFQTIFIYILNLSKSVNTLF